MTTKSTTAEDRLAELGIHLPEAPTPFGAYVPAVLPDDDLLGPVAELIMSATCPLSRRSLRWPSISRTAQ